MTRKNRIDTEQANKKLNHTFYEEKNREDHDVEQLINISAEVLNNSKEKDKDNEDM